MGRDTFTLELGFQHRMNLGEYLRKTREGKGLTTLQVARRAFGLEKAHAAVSRIERACLERLPVARLVELVDFYGVDFQDVLTRTEKAAWPRDAEPGEVSARRLRQLRLALNLDHDAFGRLSGLPTDETLTPVQVVIGWEKGLLELTDEDILFLSEEQLPGSFEVWWLAGYDSAQEMAAHRPSLQRGYEAVRAAV